MKRVLFLGFSVALLAMALAVPALAARPQQVTIEVVNTFAGGPPTGTFTASPSTADGGSICPSGTTLDTLNKFSGYESGHKVQIQVLKQFTCGDGSGTFLIKMQIHVDATGETFTWVVMSGTGDYGHLNGSGQGATVSLPDDPIGVGHNQNTYTGHLIH